MMKDNGGKEQRRRSLSSSSTPIAAATATTPITATRIEKEAVQKIVPSWKTENEQEEREKYSIIIKKAKESIQRKLYDPCTLLRFESMHDTDSASCSMRLTKMEAMGLSYIPWKIQMRKSNKEKVDHDNKKEHLQASSYPYPKWNYLAIRHKQNVNLVSSLFEKGVSYAKSGLQKQREEEIGTRESSMKDTTMNISSNELLENAEMNYKQGLDLIPSHIGILTAYSALCINANRLHEAKSMLEDVMKQQHNYYDDKIKNENSIDDNDDKNHDNTDDGDDSINNSTMLYDVDYGGENVIQNIYKDAKLYLNVVEQKIEQQQQQQQHYKLQKHEVNSTSTTRQKTIQLHLSNKVNDLIAERSFLVHHDDGDDNSGMKKRQSKMSKKYELLSSSEDEHMHNLSSSSSSNSTSTSISSTSDSDDIIERNGRWKRKRSQRSRRKGHTSTRKSISNEKSKRKKQRQHKSKDDKDDFANEMDTKSSVLNYSHIGGSSNCDEEKKPSKDSKKNHDKDSRKLDDNSDYEKSRKKKRKKHKHKKEYDKDQRKRNRRKRKKHHKRRSRSSDEVL